MPKIIFDMDEVLIYGEAVINSSGNIYIETGRKYKGMKVAWLIPKKQGTETTGISLLDGSKKQM